MTAHVQILSLLWTACLGRVRNNATRFVLTEHCIDALPCMGKMAGVSAPLGNCTAASEEINFWTKAASVAGSESVKGKGLTIILLA